MSPRRSSRARTTQPSPLAMAQTNSSSSSVTSDRAHRATRSNIKAVSPQRSAPRSQSQDDAEDTPKPPPRRTRSGANDIKEPSATLDDGLDEEEDDGADENEVTRCICRHLDFQGMTSPMVDLLKKVNYAPADGNPIGDFFLQCDECKVWQHGGCVGIVDQDHSPEEYFCEQCRKDLHRVAMSPEGQKYSRYMPIMSEPPYRQSPKPGTRAGKGKDEKPRQSAELLAQKRRQTLNSRSEQEELERAIEESKRETVATTPTATASASASSRSGKRGRDDSHDGKSAVPNKRQRTDSQSPGLEPKPEDASETEPNDTSMELTPRSRIRGAAARNHQAKEAREARERQRQAAANARQARSERRRIDESDAEEPKDDAVLSTAPSSPPPDAASSSRGQKKKPQPGRRGRATNNQQSHDEESPVPEGDDGLLNTNPHNTRARSRSRSVVREEEMEDIKGHSGANGTYGGMRPGPLKEIPSVARIRDGLKAVSVFDDSILLGKPSKVKTFNEKRTSMNEMRKRMSAISEFVGRAPVETPTSKSTSASRSGSEGRAGGNGSTKQTNGVAANSNAGTPDTNGTAGTQRIKELTDIITNQSGPDFDMLSTEDMIQNLRNRTRVWQELFGKYGDK